MGVRVIDRESQQEVEISSAELQQDIEQGAGRFVIPAGALKVVREGNRTGTVSAENAAQALAEGWRLADDEEHAAATIRREESDLGSQFEGAAEATLAGATFGLSTQLDAALGDDPERMRARREGLGGLGTALEIGGALAPALITGGGSLAASGTRAGVAGRAALATPAGATARLGLGVERGLGAALARAPSLVRTTVPVAGRGAVEGFAAGVGQEIDESALGDRDLTAERLLYSGGTGALLGAGAGAIIPGLASAGAGLGRVTVTPIKQVLAKAWATGSDDAGVGIIARLASDEGLQRKAAAIWNVDPEDVRKTFGSLKTPAEARELLDMMQNPSAYTERVAADLRTPFDRLRAARSATRQEFGGVQRIRHVEKNLPKDLDSLVRAKDRAIGALDELDGAASRAIEGVTPGQLNAADMRTVRQLVRDARDEIAAASASATGKSGARIVAATAHRAVDRVKQSLFLLKDRHRRIVNSGSPTLDSQDTLAFFDGVPGRDGVYKRLAKSLEDEETWGAAGVAQQEINRAAAEAISARRALKGTASGRILDPNRPIVDNADLLAVAKQAGGRFSGATKTELLEEAIAKEASYFDAAARHLDLSPTTKQAHAEFRAALNDIADGFKRQRTKVEKLDAAERMRVMDTDRSPTSSILSGAGTTVLGLAGLHFGGPLGAAVGAGAGLLTRPSKLLRTVAAIQARSSVAAGKQQSAIGGFLKTIGTGVDESASRIGGAVRRAAPVAAVDMGRSEHLAATRSRARSLATNPEALATEIRKMTVDLHESAPHLSTAIAGKATAIVQFLHSKAPVGYKAPWSNGEPLIDPVAEAEYERYVEACTDPVGCLAQLELGTFTKEHAEALRVCWPAVYRDVQAQTIDALARAQDSGTEIPLQALTTMSVLFETPGDPTLAMAPAIALAFAGAPPEQQAGPGGAMPTKVPASFEINTDRYSTSVDKIGTIT